MHESAEEGSYRLRQRQAGERKQREQLLQEAVRLANRARPPRQTNGDTFAAWPGAPRPQYEHLESNDFTLVTADEKLAKLRGRRFACDCDLPAAEDLVRGELGCGNDCINRALNIECGSKCPVLEVCSNRRFQQLDYAPSEPFYAGPDKGWGLRATALIPKGTFIVEYVGEVVTFNEFRRRIHRYERLKQQHHYFMQLGPDFFIDAGTKGNWARFVNHSCEPNAETQKWNVSGTICIGFFAVRDIQPLEEITIDYQFMQYGARQQACYCGSTNCSGIMGVTSKQLQDKVRTRDTKNVERRILQLLALDSVRNADDVTLLLQVMVQECLTRFTRMQLLSLLAKTQQESLLRLFRQYNGLELLCSYMTDATSTDWQLKHELLKCLDIIPVTERKQVQTDSRLMDIVDQWRKNPRFNRPRASSSSSSPEESPIKPKSVDSESSEAASTCTPSPELEITLSADEETELIDKIKRLAGRIHDNWSVLPWENYRIPRTERQETEKELKMHQSASLLNRDRSLNNIKEDQSWAQAGVSPSQSRKRSSFMDDSLFDSPAQKAQAPELTSCGVSRRAHRANFEAQIREQEAIERSRVERKQKIDRLRQQVSQLSAEHSETVFKAVSQILISRVAELQAKLKNLKLEAKNEAQVVELEQQLEKMSHQLLGLFDQKNVSQLIDYWSTVVDDLQPICDLADKLSTKDEEPSLPSYWITATDPASGRRYYFNQLTSESQWDPPLASNEAPNSSKSSDGENAYNSEFAKAVQTVVQRALRPFRLPNCLTGRITCDEDYVYLVKKLTVNYVRKEYERTAWVDGDALTEAMKQKIHTQVRRYLTAKGPVYQRCAY